MPKSRFVQIVKKLDDSKFQKLKKVTMANMHDNAQILYDNIWSMFKIPTTKEKKLSVSDFAWTDQVKKQFYDHPYHKLYVTEMRKKQHAFSWGMFLLNAEPADYDIIRKASKRKCKA